MKYKIALTDPVTVNQKTAYGVRVHDEKDAVIYVEHFQDKMHADLHAERLAALLKIVGGGS